MSKNWLSLSQLVALTGKSRPTIYNWIKTNRIVAIRVGGHYRIYMSEYNRYLREGLLPNQTEEEESQDNDR